ncbi:hypothetical protein BDZ45DRAFT_764487 [Acephala macrosclerotiorum]|nr:hypothetical protein BDZ45DRAFT_764487 [Acephala macrosclerotiorum]
MAMLLSLQNTPFAKQLRERNIDIDVPQVVATANSDETPRANNDFHVCELPEIRLNGEKGLDNVVEFEIYIPERGLHQKSQLETDNFHLSALERGKFFIPNSEAGRESYLPKSKISDPNVEVREVVDAQPSPDNRRPEYATLNPEVKWRTGSHNVPRLLPPGLLLNGTDILAYQNKAFGQIPSNSDEDREQPRGLDEQDIFKEGELLVGRHLPGATWERVGAEPDERSLLNPGIPREGPRELGTWETFSDGAHDPGYTAHSNVAASGLQQQNGGGYTEVSNTGGNNGGGYSNGPQCPHGTWSNRFCNSCWYAHGGKPDGQGNGRSGGGGGGRGRRGGGDRDDRGYLPAHALGWLNIRKEQDCYLHHKTWGGFCHQDCQPTNPQPLNQQPDHGHPPPDKHIPVQPPSSRTTHTQQTYALFNPVQQHAPQAYYGVPQIWGLYQAPFAQQTYAQPNPLQKYGPQGSLNVPQTRGQYPTPFPRQMYAQPHPAQQYASQGSYGVQPTGGQYQAPTQQQNQ